VLLLSLGITAAVVAWGYLVYLAIDFGTAARDGDARGWLYLAMATLGGIACLFIALTLWARFAAGVRAATASPAPPRPPGGRRAAR
jgi:TRAP-type C4-dicarboxylate transport system permease small subunit